MSSHIERARLLLVQRRYELAEREIGLGLAEDPNDPIGFALLALCQLARKKYEEATGRAQQAVGLGPAIPYTHYVLAHVWMARNHLDEAETAIGEAIALAPSDAVHFAMLSQIRFLRRKWKLALESAEAALALDPEHINALNLRAKALSKMGRTSVAQQQLRDALQVDPDDPSTHANLGWTALQNGDRVKAMEHFREALRLEPEMDWAREGVLETLRSKSRFYRVLLKYNFWLSRFSKRGQWGVILGAGALFLLAREAAQLGVVWAVVFVPMMIAYLVFVAATWLAAPLSNLVLRLHPFGRLALSREDRIASNLIGGCLLGAIGAAIGWAATGNDFAILAMLYFLLMLLPLQAIFEVPAPWPRKGLVIYTIILGLCGVIWLFDGAVTDDMLRTWPTIAANAFILLERLLVIGFPLGAALSSWAGNILISIEWKK